MINVTQVNKPVKPVGILKKTESMKHIGSSRGSKGPGSIVSNRDHSAKSERGLANSHMIKPSHEMYGLNNSNTMMRRNQSVNISRNGSVCSYDSNGNPQRKVAGSIFKGNSAHKNDNSIVRGNALDITSPTNNLERSKILIQDSPVIILDKELNFYTEESKENEDLTDLNELLQLNEPKEEPEPKVAPRHLQEKHKTLRNLPRPFVPKQSIFSCLKSLKDPITIQNTKITDPIPCGIFQLLSHPLTTLRLKLTSIQKSTSHYKNLTSLFEHSFTEPDHPLMKALQLRLVKILHKNMDNNKLLKLVVRIQE